MIDQTQYIVKPLETESRAAFECGEETLDRYFHQQASRDIQNGLSAVFVVVPHNDLKKIAGFFTLSSQQIACDIVVDAKNENVVPFCEKYGFRRLEGNRLMLLMQTIEDLVGGHKAEETATATPLPPA